MIPCSVRSTHPWLSTKEGEENDLWLWSVPSGGEARHDATVSTPTNEARIDPQCLRYAMKLIEFGCPTAASRVAQFTPSPQEFDRIFKTSPPILNAMSR